MSSSDRTWSPTFVGFLFLVAVASVVINVPLLQLEPVLLWVRVLCPVLLAFGAWGGLRHSQSLRTLGWFGISLFALCAIGMIFPGEDYMSGGFDGPPLAAPRMLTKGEITLRAILFLSLIAALIFGYIRIGRRQGAV